MLPTLLFIAAFAAALAGAVLHHRLTGPLRWGIHALAPLLLAASLLLSPGEVVYKLAARLIMPVGLLWLLGFALGWWLALRNQPRAAAATLAAWLLVSLAGSSWVGTAMLRRLERDIAPPPSDTRFDAVIVLGGGTELAPWGTPQLSHAGDRLRTGAMLYARGQTPLLVCTGTAAAGVDQPQARNLAREAALLLEGMGVPRTAILELPGPINTHGEIAALAALANEQGWRRIGLVTSAWHLRRTMRLAARAGLDATPIPADARGHNPPPNVMAVVPSGSGFYLVQIAWKELIGAWLGR